MSDKVVLGIHSHVDPNTQGSFNQFVDGHAWISVTRDGQTTFHGLWPDDHPRVEDNGPRSDIREGMEARSTPSASRFYELTPEQVKRLDQALGENVTWSYGNTCASWATSTVNNVTGQSLDAGELMFTDTPRELIESIRKAERLQPTSPSQPQPAAERPETSIPSLSDASNSLHQQALAGVHALDASLGRASDESSQRMAASLTQLARTQGLDRIDHVVLGLPTGQSPRPENIFVVQGALDDPGHLRARINIEAALQQPVAESLRQIHQLDRQLAASPQQAEPALEEIQRRQMV
jgi:hypothetical protein